MLWKNHTIEPARSKLPKEKYFLAVNSSLNISMVISQLFQKAVSGFIIGLSMRKLVKTTELLCDGAIPLNIQDLEVLVNQQALL